MIFDSCTLIFGDKPPLLSSTCQYWTGQDLLLKNPSNSKITMLDEEGNQVEVNSVEQLDDQLPIGIQLWFSSDIDLVITIQQQWGLWVENYYFEGVNEDERRRLITKLNNRTSSLMSQTSILGVIYDYKQNLANKYYSSINIS